MNQRAQQSQPVAARNTAKRTNNKNHPNFPRLAQLILILIALMILFPIFNKVKLSIYNVETFLFILPEQLSHGQTNQQN
jgi:hypothetical protein